MTDETLRASVASSAPAALRARIARAHAERARRRRRRDPAFELTPRQREVALLAAAGLDNAQIARRLWVTRRTVEFHLTNVYRRLRVAGRVELALRLGAGRSLGGMG